MRVVKKLKNDRLKLQSVFEENKFIMLAENDSVVSNWMLNSLFVSLYRIFTEGQLFGELILESEQKRTASAVAIEFTELLSINGKEYAKYFKDIRLQKESVKLDCLSNLLNKPKRVIKEQYLELLYSTQELDFQRGSRLITEGDALNQLMVIYRGGALVTKQKSNHLISSAISYLNEDSEFNVYSKLALKVIHKRVIQTGINIEDKYPLPLFEIGVLGKLAVVGEECLKDRDRTSFFTVETTSTCKVFCIRKGDLRRFIPDSSIQMIIRRFREKEGARFSFLINRIFPSPRIKAIGKSQVRNTHGDNQFLPLSRSRQVSKYQKEIHVMSVPQYSYREENKILKRRLEDSKIADLKQKMMHGIFCSNFPSRRPFSRGVRGRLSQGGLLINAGVADRPPSITKKRQGRSVDVIEQEPSNSNQNDFSYCGRKISTSNFPNRKRARSSYLLAQQRD